MKKIIITGATGSIGKKLCNQIIDRGDALTVFSRNPELAKKIIRGASKYVKCDFTKPDEWKEYLNYSDVIVHLAGANLGAKRWNQNYKKLAYDSRVISTRNLVTALKSVDEKPKAFISSSAVGFYGNRYDEDLDELSLPADNYLANLCKDWEKEAAEVEDIGIRRVSVRTGLVLSKYEGLLKQMIPTFKLFLGGYLGNGKQWFPWIHIDDIVGIYIHAIDNESAEGELSGAVNATSPGIVRMKEFAKKLGKVLNRPVLFPIPIIAVKILKGELGNYATDSQRITVDKLLQTGYKFKFENIEDALRDLLKK
jgi:uncharacterized protein (TIGR01777 family)